MAIDMLTQQMLAASVVPVVLISASGLVTLALYNRLAAVLARVRGFQHEQLEELRAHHHGSTVSDADLQGLLRSQIAQVTRKARLLQAALSCQLGAVLAFLACSVFCALATLHAWIGVLALGSHLLGLGLFATGIGWAMIELRSALQPLIEETAFLVKRLEQSPRVPDQAPLQRRAG
jgi:hypothetical protein